VVALVVFMSPGAAGAADPVEVQARLETEPFFDADDADADDPAIWVHPSNGAKSIVIGTLKNGGLAVFDLQGRTIQRIDYVDEDARQNNVDLLYGVELGGTKRDLAVVTDRGLDHLRVFAIDQAGSSTSTPLTEVTEPDPPVIFEGTTTSRRTASPRGRVPTGPGTSPSASATARPWSCFAWFRRPEEPSASNGSTGSCCPRPSR
jgi:3-phytase